MLALMAIPFVVASAMMTPEAPFPPTTLGATQRLLRKVTIPAGLPPGLVIGNKTGWIDGVNHDVALVRAEGHRPIGLAVLCSAPGTREDREAGIARIAAAAWDLVFSPGAGVDPTMTA